MSDAKVRTRGFGVPDTVDPHHFIVRVPKGSTGDILIIENFGLNAASDYEEHVLRCRLPRRAWAGIKDEARRVLNERLQEKKLAPGRWIAGDTPVERLLGRELCVLAWSVEKANSDAYPAACASWAALKPEEKWWLFRMCDDAVGFADDADIGWRKAVRIAFTETPGPLTPVSHKRIKTQRNKSEADLFSLPIIEEH